MAPLGAKVYVFLKMRLRLIAFLILFCITGWHFLHFFQDDWQSALRYWQGQSAMILLAFGICILDQLIDYGCWLWAYRVVGIRPRGLKSLAVCLSIHAAVLLPLQLGRVVRPDLSVRMHWSTLAQALKAEGLIFFFEVVAVLLVLTGLLGVHFLGLIGLFIPAALLLGSLFAGALFSHCLAATRWTLPSAFWWKGTGAILILLRACTWLLYGLSLYLLIFQLPVHPPLDATVFYGVFSGVAGSGSGLPGGIGATESMLGLFLGYMDVPAAHLAVAIAVFRIVTFWALLPIGWLALSWSYRVAPGKAKD